MKPGDSNNPLTDARSQVPADHAPFANSALVPGAAANVGPRALASTPPVGALLHALKRRWMLAFVLATVAAALTVAGIAVLMPPKFVAQTLLKLDARPSRQIFQQSAGADAEVDPAIFRATQLALVKSSTVLSSALKSAKLKGLPIGLHSTLELNNALTADFAVGAEVMTLSLRGEEPEHLADLLAAIVDAYKQEVNGGDVERQNRITGDLEKIKVEYETKLKDKRVALEGELARLGPQQKMLEDQFRQAERKVQSVTDDLRRNRLDLTREKLKAAALKARLDTIEQEPISQRELQKAIDAARAANRRLLAALKPLFDLDTEYDIKIAQWMGEKDTPIRKSALDSLLERKVLNQARIDAGLKAVRGEVEKEIRADRKEKLVLELSAQNILVDQVENAERTLKIEFEASQAGFDAAREAQPKVPLAVQKLKDEAAQILKTLDQLNAALALVKAEPPPASKISVLSPAETPNDRDYSRLVKFAGAGACGVFGLVLFSVAFLEFRQRKVNTLDEVTHGLGMHLVGTLPKVPARMRRPLASSGPPGNYWQSLNTESVDAIRTQLLHAARADAVHILMVTSASCGEGKTSLASQLAASLARSWRKTLLVDGDLRNPAAHKLFDLQLEPGFSEVLRGDVAAADAIKPTALSRLWMMPAGNWDAHAVQALAQDGVRAMFDQLQEHYDFVVVDSCPVLPVADSLVLAQHVDVVIFSILRDVSRMPAVHAAQQKLQALDVRTLGAVVIGVAGDAGSIAYNYSAQAGS